MHDATNPIWNTAREILGSLPCAIQLPAGAGKTDLIAAVTSLAAQGSQRVLVLTHTHAGVDALRNRMQNFSVPRDRFSIRTIDSWCFEIIQNFPKLSEFSAPSEPNWEQSIHYHTAATKAVTTSAVAGMLVDSFGLILVDEYQDCTIEQHGVILGIKRNVPTAVFGDSMQGVLDFGGNVLISWERNVEPNFQSIEPPVYPWRWHQCNPSLGRWLLDIRAQLSSGYSIDLRKSPVRWIGAGDSPQKTVFARRDAFKALRQSEGTVVGLGSFRSDIAIVAAQLGGEYGLMEEIQGNEILRFAAAVDSRDALLVASKTAEFAKGCAIGVAAYITAEHRRALARGKKIGTRNQDLLEPFARLNNILENTSPASVRSALIAIQSIDGVSVYCREAWQCALSALEYASLDGTISVRDYVVRERNSLRRTGRSIENRIISRPVLVKGLEFCHAVLLDADRYTAAELYVALSRGSHSVTVISRSSIIQPKVRLRK